MPEPAGQSFSADTDFLLDLGEDDPLAHRAHKAILGAGFQWWITPTVQVELEGHLSKPDTSDAAANVVAHFGDWQLRLQVSGAEEKAQARRLANLFTANRLIDRGEHNDARILIESAQIGAAFLVSRDNHLNDAQHEIIAVELWRAGFNPVTVIKPASLARRRLC